MGIFSFNNGAIHAQNAIYVPLTNKTNLTA